MHEVPCSDRNPGRGREQRRAYRRFLFGDGVYLGGVLRNYSREAVELHSRELNLRIDKSVLGGGLMDEFKANAMSELD